MCCGNLFCIRFILTVIIIPCIFVSRRLVKGLVTKRFGSEILFSIIALFLIWGPPKWWSSSNAFLDVHKVWGSVLTGIFSGFIVGILLMTDFPLALGQSDTTVNTKSGTKKLPNDKEYEYLTDHLDYLNDKIIDAFKLFIKLATAITGGLFYLSFSDHNNLNKAYLVSMSDGLFLAVSICAIFLIWSNLDCWRKYRVTLYNKYQGIPPIRKDWGRNETMMILIIILLSGIFLCFNPLNY